MTQQANIYGTLAMAHVNGEAPAFLDQRGFDDIVESSTGNYVLTLTNGCDLIHAGMIQMGFDHGTPLFSVGAVEVVTSTAIRVRTASITTATPPVVAAANLMFWIKLSQFSPN